MTEPAGPSAQSPPAEPPPPDRWARPRRWWARLRPYALLELAALCGLALAQPVLDVTGKAPDFFLFYGATAGQILTLVLIVCAVPPLLLWGAEALAGLAGERARHSTHLVFVGGLFAALAVQVGKQMLAVRGAPLALLAILLGAALAAAYARWRVLAQLLRVAAVGPVAFALLFVFASPASAVVMGGGERGAGPGVRASSTHPPIVLLLLDEFPQVSLLGSDGEIDVERFPNFARLASGSTWYRNATAVSGWTPQAVPAMLTGRYPSSAEKAPHYAHYPNNLFALLDGVYQLRAQETVTQLCRPGQCIDGGTSAAGGLRVLLRESASLLEQIVSPVDSATEPESSYREVTAQEASGRSRTSAGTKFEEQPAPSDPKFRWYTLDENQPARFRTFLGGLTPTDAPTLHFLHLLMPHSPYRYLPSGMQYPAPDDMLVKGDGWVQVTHQRMLQQVQYTDRLVGEMLHTLETSGLYQDALVIVTADHGVSFARGEASRAIDPELRAAPETLWVPLFVKAPGQTAGGVDDRNWEHVDLLPTLADYAGVRVPWQTDGISALRETRTTAAKRFYDDPRRALTVPGPENFALVRGGSDTLPGLAPLPYQELVGTRTGDLAVTPGAGEARIANLPDFAAVDPAGGTIPALVYGSVSDSVPDGTPVAVAVNGRIGAVAPVAAADSKGRRFEALVTDETLLRTGANQVEVFEVTGGGTGLRRLTP